MPNLSSLSFRVRAVAVATGLFLLAAPSARAQGKDSVAKAPAAPVTPAGAPTATTGTAADSMHRQAAQDAYDRARALVVNGQAAEGRRVVDSLLSAAPAGSAAYADALYWRATLASTAADAERDYRRIIVEFPLSMRTGDALLALAQLEMTRNDRDAAIGHLQRFLLEYPERPERTRAGIWLGRLQIETGDVLHGCRQLGRVRASIASSDVELLNQVDYQMARCSGVDTTGATAPAPAAPSGVPATAPAAGKAPTPKVAPNTTAATSPTPPKQTAKQSGPRYSVQVAAFLESKDAESLVRRLTARGYQARTTQSGRYYRVRVGRYPSREEAVKVRDELKSHGTIGFVTEAEPESN